MLEGRQTPDRTEGVTFGALEAHRGCRVGGKQCASIGRTSP